MLLQSNIMSVLQDKCSDKEAQKLESLFVPLEYVKWNVQDTALG